MKKKNNPKRLPLIASLLTVAVCAVLSTFFLFLKPSNNRHWVEEFSVLPDVEIDGDVVTIHNIRDWRHSEKETTSHHYISRAFDSNKLERVWFLIEPFGQWDGVAHTYFVFDFIDQEPVSFSIEARREVGEEYSAFLGLFKKYELIYMWGTEQDFTLKRVVQLKNDVHMYPMTVSGEFQKKLFMELAYATQQLKSTPRFYNTLSSNCTNNLAYHANNIQSGAAPFHYARFLTGYSGQYLYDLGYIPTQLPYEKVKEQYHINTLIDENSINQESFSQDLREKLLQ